MPDIYGAHFEFDGRLSRKYRLIIANVDSERNLNLTGTIAGNTVYDKRGKQRLSIGNDYTDFPMSFDIDIVTDDCSILEQHEIREINRWLFNNNTYKKFYVDIANDPTGEMTELVDGEIKRLYTLCRFANPRKLEYYGGIVGFTVTMELNSGCWWQDPIIKRFSWTRGIIPPQKQFAVVVDSDLDDYTYPHMIIDVGSGGTISIVNNNDNDYLTSFINLEDGASITMYSDTNYITPRYYDNFNGRHFPRLVNGINDYTITGDIISIQIEYSNRRLW